MTGQVFCNGDCTNSFNISNGVKEGCTLVPVLFNLFFSQVLLHTVKDLDRGVYVRNCSNGSNGSVFDLRRLSARTKTVEKLTTEALFADDCALMAHRENHLHTIVGRFAEASRLFWLTISLGKIDVLVQAGPNTSHPQPNITTEGVQMKFVEGFKYLGSTVSSYRSLDREISSRFHKASQALGRLKVKNPPAERHQTVNEAQGLQGCSCLHSALWMWDMDYITQALQTDGTVSHMGTAHDHWHSLAGQSHKPRSTGQGWFNKHRINAAEGSVKLDWPCHQNIWLSYIQTAAVRRAHVQLVQTRKA